MPRMMFPPPTTIASSTPRCWTPTISSAIAATRAGSRPCSRSPISASPESFRRTRRETGRSAVLSAGTASVLVTLAELEPLELEHLGAFLAERLADRLCLVVDPDLLGEHL